MPQNIQIRSTDCDDDLLMYAKPEVAKDSKGETLKIHNQVKSANPIKIKFYPLDKKGESGEEIPGFCTEMGSDTVLTIDENNNADCTIPTTVNQKYYAYTVENDDAGILDPVIIIDDAFEVVGGGFSFLAMLFMGGGGIAAGVLGAAGYRFFKSRSKAAS